MISSSVLAYWTHDLSPFVIRFNESFGIRYYGLAYLLGFLTAAWFFKKYVKRGRSLLPVSQIMDFITAIVIGVFVGGRLGYFILYQPSSFIHDPLALLRVWEGGMASHGGFLGVAAAIAWFARSQRIRFWHLCDLVASTTGAGLLFGRIANFINGELWGKVATVPWAVIFPYSPAPLLPRHPSQLYEALLEGAIMLAYAQWRFWRSDVTTRHPGRLAGEFWVGYALVRAIGEMFREPDAALIFGLSRGTFYSAFLISAGLWMILRKSTPLNQKP